MLFALVLTVAGCSSGDGADEPEVGAVSSSPTTSLPSTTSPGEPLRILVTNDDGVGAEGLDVLVNALQELPGVEVSVVVPAADEIGSSDATTPDPTYEAAQTASGVAATAVNGKPADAVLVALDELGIEPDVVLSGANSVQNLGPAVEPSGTIGAARTAARRGIPAVALSQGSGGPPDYETGVSFVVAWIEENRSALADGTATVEVVSINAPTCTTGEVRGIVEVPVDSTGASGGFLDPADCESTLSDPTTDIEAFLNGFVTLSVVGF